MIEELLTINSLWSNLFFHFAPSDGQLRPVESTRDPLWKFSFDVSDEVYDLSFVPKESIFLNCFYVAHS